MKTTKKFLCFFLAIIIAISATTIAFATEEVEQTCPLIYIPGFTSSNVYDDISDESTLLDYPVMEDILAVVTEAFIPALMAFSVNRDTDKLVTSVTDRINELFAYWFNESTGEAKEGSGIIPQELTEVSADSKLTFSYDWRGDPVKIADSLHTYIETVCELSGCEKVALGCHSLGSTVALAYLTAYGNERISAIVFDSPACNGVALIGNILTGQVNIDAETAGFFLKNILGETQYTDLITSIIDILDSAGLVDLVVRFTDEIIEALAPAVYRETVAPLFGYWPTIWSMVPDAQVEQAKSYIFDEILKDKDLSVLEEKIDYYNTHVRAKRTETLQSFDSTGNFAVLSRYTQRTIPLRGSSQLIGDTIIETTASSLGAITAAIGDCFGEEYLLGKDLKYISPDRTVDASTCLFPEQTWFIKDSGHFETGELTTDYYDMFLFAKEELTCDTAEIGRFTICDKSTYTLIEDASTAQKLETPTVIKIIFNFVAALTKLIGNLLAKAF